MTMRHFDPPYAGRCVPGAGLEEDAVAVAGRRAVLRGFTGFAAGAGLAAAWPAGASAQDEFDRAALKGAGSTFVYPLVVRWVKEYRHHLAGGIRFTASNAGLDDDMNGVALDYEPVGSLAGLQRLKAGAVDFALSEMPLPPAELSRGGLIQFPVVLGAVALAANLPAIAPGRLQLGLPLLADILLGRVTRWDDPAIRALNPGLALPDAAIGTVHRRDGSGTTFTLTRTLAALVPEWRERVGADLLVKWPVGSGVRGSRGMAEALRRTPHALGYLDDVQAREAGLVVASLRNAAGRFVAPSPSAVAAAALSSSASDGFQGVAIDPSGEGAYPLIASVFGLMSDRLQNDRQGRTRAFFDWSLSEGRASAERLGYVPLPEPVLAEVRRKLAR